MNEFEEKVCMDEVVESEPVQMSKFDRMKIKAKDFVKDNAVGIVCGALGLTYFGFCGLMLYKQYKTNQAFIASVRELYGSNVTEGSIFGGNPAKLWGMRKTWEETGKENFDKLKELVGTLNLAKGEQFTVEKLNGGKHANEIEIFHMLDNGFFHNEYM